MHASIINAPHLHHPLNAEGSCHPEDQLPLPSVRNHEDQQPRPGRPRPHRILPEILRQLSEHLSQPHFNLQKPAPEKSGPSPLVPHRRVPRHPAEPLERLQGTHRCDRPRHLVEPFHRRQPRQQLRQRPRLLPRQTAQTDLIESFLSDPPPDRPPPCGPQGLTANKPRTMQLPQTGVDVRVIPTPKPGPDRQRSPRGIPPQRAAGTGHALKPAGAAAPPARPNCPEAPLFPTPPKPQGPVPSLRIQPDLKRVLITQDVQNLPQLKAPPPPSSTRTTPTAPMPSTFTPPPAPADARPCPTGRGPPTRQPRPLPGPEALPPPFPQPPRHWPKRPRGPIHRLEQQPPACADQRPQARNPRLRRPRRVVHFFLNPIGFGDNATPAPRLKDGHRLPNPLIVLQLPTKRNHPIATHSEESLHIKIARPSAYSPGGSSSTPAAEAATPWSTTSTSYGAPTSTVPSAPPGAAFSAPTLIANSTRALAISSSRTRNRSSSIS